MPCAIDEVPFWRAALPRVLASRRVFGVHVPAITFYPQPTCAIVLGVGGDCIAAWEWCISWFSDSWIGGVAVFRFGLRLLVSIASSRARRPRSLLALRLFARLRPVRAAASTSARWGWVSSCFRYSLLLLCLCRRARLRSQPHFGIGCAGIWCATTAHILFLTDSS